MTMTLGDIRAFVWSTVDITVTDLPTAVLDVWIRDGYDRIIAYESRWPSMEVQYAFSSVPAQQSYLMSSIDAGDLRDISALVDTGVGGVPWKLLLVPHEEALITLNPQNYSSGGKPYFYSKNGGYIYLWPSPSTTYTYAVVGHRKPIDWVSLGAGATPDCASRLHVSIAYWALRMYYAQQEDPAMTQLYENQFKEGVQMAHDHIMKTNEDHPLIVNQGWVNPTYSSYLLSLSSRGSSAFS